MALLDARPLWVRGPAASKVPPTLALTDTIAANANVRVTKKTMVDNAPLPWAARAGGNIWEQLCFITECRQIEETVKSSERAR